MEASDEALAKLDQDRQCTRLTIDQVAVLQHSYPSPKLKRRYRTLEAVLEAGDFKRAPEQFATDEAKRKVVEILQTVRSRFYLIDVPVLEQTLK